MALPEIKKPATRSPLFRSPLAEKSPQQNGFSRKSAQDFSTVETGAAERRRAMLREAKAESSAPQGHPPPLLSSQSPKAANLRERRKAEDARLARSAPAHVVMQQSGRIQQQQQPPSRLQHLRPLGHYAGANSSQDSPAPGNGNTVTFGAHVDDARAPVHDQDSVGSSHHEAGHLPDISRASPAGARPGLRRSYSFASTFLSKMDGIGEDETKVSDPDSDSEDSVSIDARTDHSITTKAAMAKEDRRYLQAREDDVLRIANRLGMVKNEQKDELQAIASGPKGRPPSSRVIKQQSSTLTVSQIHPMGVSFRVLLKFADSVDPDLSTYEVFQKHIQPTTRDLKCRYVDIINEKLVGQPSYFISHCYKANFVKTVQYIKQYFQQLKLNPDDTYVWLDVFCVNAYTERNQLDLQVLREIIGNVDKMLFIIDKEGASLTRTWCLYELWLASLSGLQDKVIPLTMHHNWDEVAHIFATLDMGKSSSTRDKDRLMLLQDVQKTTDPSSLSGALKQAMLDGAKREMWKAEKLASVNPKRYTMAAMATAMLLDLMLRYSEAEDILRAVVKVQDKAPPREVTQYDEATVQFMLANVLKDQGRYPDADRLLQEFTSQYRGMPGDIFLDGMASYADVLVQKKQHTKAEMLCRKVIEEKEKMYGKMNPSTIRSLLQLAHTAVSQKLYEEADDYYQDCLDRCNLLYSGQEHPDMGACFHGLATCLFHQNNWTKAEDMLAKALAIKNKTLGIDHPVTLESRMLQAEILMTQADALVHQHQPDVHGARQKLAEAEGFLASVYKSRLRAYGPDHPSTLAAMGVLADLLRKNDSAHGGAKPCEQAVELEKKLLNVGRGLLKANKIDKFRALSYISLYLSKRDYLLDKAAMFLAKAFVVYKEKLGGEHELTQLTRQQLLDIMDREKSAAGDALEQAEVYNSAPLYQKAEVLYKQVYSVSKLLMPEGDHANVARNLADALFGQGKVQEARNILKAAGLTRKGMKQNMPASYLRWLNTRVAKYMDKTAEDGMFDDDG